ncbi:transcription factor IBH1-like [Tasmannia lanceolata]|uniref:transcription factor IBH1-like n=1 Tax=Tasmannia lanceolata TaxID=3420 RepID=UPI004063E967
MHPKLSSSNPNPNSLHHILASRFLKSLSKISLHKPSSSAAIIRRSRRIKLAAYASMASAIGPKRAWSRAMLRKLRSRAKRRVSFQPKGTFVDKGNKGHEPRRANDLRRLVAGVPSRADELRRLVPGGEAMGFCSLLEEAADYIRCLSTQVQVMENVVESLSL